MKIKLTKSQEKFIKNGNLVLSEDGDKYYFLPYFYKEISGGVFEEMTEGGLPAKLKEIIDSMGNIVDYTKDEQKEQWADTRNVTITPEAAKAMEEEYEKQKEHLKKGVMDKKRQKRLIIVKNFALLWVLVLILGGIATLLESDGWPLLYSIFYIISSSGYTAFKTILELKDIL